MADRWIVSGAGDSDYNGTYDESREYAGKPYYALGDDDYFLFYTIEEGKSPAFWWLGEELNIATAAYKGAGSESSLPANTWQVCAGFGTEPAPTLAAGVSMTDVAEAGDSLTAWRSGGPDVRTQERTQTTLITDRGQQVRLRDRSGDG